MKTFIQAVAAIVPLLAIQAEGQAVSSRCNTRMGRNAVANVPTGSTTITSTLRPTLQLSVRNTVTRWSGAVYTYTAFNTQTDTETAPVQTDIVDSTSTVYTSTPVLTTITATNFFYDVATVTSVSTTVVPTPGGFKYLDDTINNPDAFPKRKRDAAHPHQGVSPAKRAGTTVGVNAFSYATRVDCTFYKPNTNTVTLLRTLAPTTVTSPYWAARTTTVSVIHTVVTEYPDHVTSTNVIMKTEPLTYTSTILQTDSVTRSQTATALIHGPTTYDACVPRNYMQATFDHTANGVTKSYYPLNVKNNGAFVDPNYDVTANGASSMQDCCRQCMEANCETFMYRRNNRNCLLMGHKGSTCQQSNHPNFFTSQLDSSNSGATAGFQIGNGMCGYTYSGNSDGSLFKADRYYDGDGNPRSP